MTIDNNKLLQYAILAAVLGLFVYYYKTKPDDSFNEVFKRANTRLDSIATEVAKSQKLIQQTIVKLDAIRDSAKVVKQQQVTSNTTVSAAESTLKKQLQIKEQELSTMKAKYQKTIKEKDFYRDRLDSLAETIGN